VTRLRDKREIEQSAGVGKNNNLQRTRPMTKNESKARSMRIFVIAALCFTVFDASPVLAQTDSSATQDQWQFLRVR
jgi:hypothetical protein